MHFFDYSVSVSSNEIVKQDLTEEENVACSDSDASTTSSSSRKNENKNKRVNLSDVKKRVAKKKQEDKNAETVRKAVANYSSTLGNDKILQNQALMMEVIWLESIFEI